MKTSEIKELSTPELKERIEVEKNTLVKMRLNHAVSPLDNPMKLRYVRKDIARLLTELTKRESAEQN
ncbi:MAG: 50S ribosomal protein L29 [Bacteroidales bacterium]|jgi:large subunit ribosomal protein L29|nr:50S ribosomal protein L29 [Bacteroidales bacterium]